MLSFSISYPDLIKLPYLKEGDGRPKAEEIGRCNRG